jgi:glutathione synthase
MNHDALDQQQKIQRMSVFPSSLSSEDVECLQSLAIDFAASHGLIVRDKAVQQTQVQHASTALVHAPVALLPSPFPKDQFEFAYHLQPLFNHLVETVASSPEFLLESLEEVGEMDDFTGRLVAIYKDVLKQQNRQAWSL